MSGSKQDQDAARTLGLAREKRRGRILTRFDPDVALDIIERIAEGELLKDICDPHATNPTVSRATFMRWVMQQPELAQAFNEARELSAYALEEDAIDAVRDQIKTPGTQNKLRAVGLGVDQFRWSSVRRNMQKFGDKSGATFVVPVQINTTLDLGQKGGGPDNISKPQDIYSFEVPLPSPSDTDTDKPQLALPPPTPIKTQLLAQRPRVTIYDPKWQRERRGKNGKKPS